MKVLGCKGRAKKKSVHQEKGECFFQKGVFMKQEKRGD